MGIVCEQVALASTDWLTRLRRPRQRGVSITEQQDDELKQEDGEKSEKYTDSPNADVAAPYVLTASVLIGCALGYALDEHYGTSPGWTIGMFFVFMAIGFYHLVKDVFRK